MLLSSVRQQLAKLPLSAALILGFTVVMSIMVLIAKALPPPKDLNEECKKQCNPRFSRVVPDKSFPMSPKGESNHPKVCECY
jgi:hypothetical protein